MATKRKQTRSASSAGGRGGAKRKTGRRTAGGRSASGRSSGARQMDAIKLLKQDHRAVERLVDEFERARAPKKAQIAEEICRQLTIHAQIEEELFYPQAREALRKDEDLVDEAEVEHQSAKDLIAQIQGGSPDDEKFEARVKVLGEYVKHHVREEEKGMFPQLQKSKLDLQALGEQLMRRKQELMGMETGEMADEDSAGSARGSGRGNGARSQQESATMNAAGRG